MPTTLLALHGFTMNGAGLRHMLRDLEGRVSKRIDWVYPDAPHSASADSVEGISELMGGFRPKPPNLQWWRSNQDGSVYHGWQASLEHLRRHAEQHGSIGVLGFSQGAAVAATLAALSRTAGFPPLRFAVLIAGFVPRADDLAPLFAEPVDVPSLHVFGARDSFARHSPALVERFAPATRTVSTWDGGHVVPTSGPAADALSEFLDVHST